MLIEYRRLSSRFAGPHRTAPESRARPVHGAREPQWQMLAYSYHSTLLLTSLFSAPTFTGAKFSTILFCATRSIVPLSPAST